MYLSLYWSPLILETTRYQGPATETQGSYCKETQKRTAARKLPKSLFWLVEVMAHVLLIVGPQGLILGDGGCSPLALRCDR